MANDSQPRIPCPICFDTSKEKVQYAHVDLHSWDNSDRCDAHGICSPCLARYIEIMVLDEGRWNMRCPGEGCAYHLVDADVERALQGHVRQHDVISRIEQLRSDTGQERLEETLRNATVEISDAWLLKECQPCPSCFVFARRETGCDHLVCRCGCDFCFRCGTPTGWGYECVCSWLGMREPGVTFAAWLRSNPDSTCEWLLNARDSSPTEEWSSCIDTLGFWLWLAGASVPIHMSNTATTNSTVSPILEALPPLEWLDNSGYGEEDYNFAFFDCLTDVEDDGGDDRDALQGHLRKDVVRIASASDRAIRNASRNGRSRRRKERHGSVGLPGSFGLPMELCTNATKACAHQEQSCTNMRRHKRKSERKPQKKESSARCSTLNESPQ